MFYANSTADVEEIGFDEWAAKPDKVEYQWRAARRDPTATAGGRPPAALALVPGSPMLAHVIDELACPHCGAALIVVDATLRCESGHSFDVARQGYVSLLPRGAHADTADTPAMVEARDAFLGAGYYAPIAGAVADALGSALGADASGCVVDIGAGTGYYLARVLDGMPRLAGLALDTSKPALRRAARAHER
ncbi:MAG: hypothetical protein WBI63_07195, partial [Coriobacteriia bacterium]